MNRLLQLALVLSVFSVIGFAPSAGDAAFDTSPEDRGRHNLQHNPYGMPLLNKKLLELLPRVWEPAWTSRIDENDSDSVRKLAFERYGLSEATWDNQGAPLQFVATSQGSWVQTCTLCHGGRVPVSGESKIGMPNTEIDMQTLYEDITALTGFKGPFDLVFGMSRGRTNAFIFSLELLRRRNEDLSRRKEPLPMGDYQDYDLDAPPWWYLRKKTALYSDGSVRGDFVRPIMQFTMGEPNGEKIRSWENDFKDILAFIKSIEAPRYPLKIDLRLADRGKAVFEQTCSGCHGTYNAGNRMADKYPNKVIPLDIIGTDPLRLTKLTREFRTYFQKTWFAGNGSHSVEAPTGYVAPPLDGVWASAPYFHNGSVPTVYGVLTPDTRPTYFKRTGGPEEYDSKDLGLRIETFSGPPVKDLPGEARRRIIDTTLPGLSNQGHLFGQGLSEKEKRQVIEYLKTL